MIRVTRSLTIPDSELRVSFSPSGGPGGQHANRSATRVTLEWNVATSEALGPRQKARVQRALASRLDASGVLRITSDARRSQLRNREDAEARLAALVQRALTPRKKRIPTQATAAARERRLAAKRRRAETKKLRADPSRD